MAIHSRRIVVRAVALAGVAALSGCLDPDDGGNGGDLDYELLQLGPATTDPDWHGEDGPTGTVELYRSRERASQRLEDGILDGMPEDRREDAREFLDDTDFGRSALLYVASVGPDTCHDEIEVRDLAVDGGSLTGTVAARDTSVSGQGCGDAITYPSALVRVTADPRPDRARLTVVDGWDRESTVEASAEN